jgi:hypothetical protein
VSLPFSRLSALTSSFLCDEMASQAGAKFAHNELLHPFVALNRMIRVFYPRCPTEQEPPMPTSNTPNNDTPTIMPVPLSAWWSGFEYVFGYQLKMLKEFWGLEAPDNENR